MSKDKPQNAQAGPMQYEVRRMANPRILRDQAMREGAEAMQVPESETVYTVEQDTTSGKAASKGGK